MNRRITHSGTALLAASIAVMVTGCPDSGSPSIDTIELPVDDTWYMDVDGGADIRPDTMDVADQGKQDGVDPGGTDLAEVDAPACVSAADCDDGTACTDDDCVDGGCVHKAVPDCCENDGDCADTNPCTEGKCVKDAGGKTYCQMVPIPGCCSKDGECDDNDPCTADACKDNACVHGHIPGCGGCTSNADCDDGDYCTEDECLFDTDPAGDEVSSCANHVIEACCHSDDDCLVGNPCTLGVCVLIDPVAPYYECKYQPVPGCCSSDDDCDDGNQCTIDFCGDAATCHHEPSPDCCSGPLDCQDFDPCTDDFCENGKCINPFKPGCCKEDSECDDGDYCTKNWCQPMSGVMPGMCVTEKIPDCCKDVTDCNDFDPCTDNACINGQCVFAPLPDCCIGDDQCVDDDPCTKDWCQLMSGLMPGMCIHELDPACFCDDGNPCTEDQQGPDDACQHQWIPGCCTQTADCKVASPCEKAECIQGECAYFPVQCQDDDPCTADTCDPATGQCEFPPLDCNDFDACTKDACDQAAGGCVHEAVSCDDGDDCTKDTCHPTDGCGHAWLPWCCKADTDCDDGNPCTNDQCKDGDCSSSAKDCDDAKPCTADKCDPATGDCFHYVDCDDGSACTNDWCDPQKEFTCRFSKVNCDDGDDCTADSCDPFTGCAHALVPNCQAECQADTDCDDSDPCTDDYCNDGACNNWWSGECCKKDHECDDGDPCTDDVCGADSHCTHSLNTNPCDDGNPCTLKDTCAQGACVGGGSKDCDDSDGCTTDSCDAATGDCVNEPIPDCCVPGTSWSATFTGGSDEGFGFKSAQSPVGWQVADTRWHSASHALYFGNPDALNYSNPETGVVSGHAITPGLAIPEAPASVLKFWTYLDVETIPQYDVFSVVINADDGEHVVWDKTLLPPGYFKKWYEVTINVTPFQGQTILVRFDFDSVDHLYNETEGVYVDDVTVNSLCETLPWCQSDGECLDDNPCTTDRCAGNTCTHEVVLGCCTKNADCDDKYVCTTDVCAENQCIHAKIPNCCVDSAECDDGNPCTQDVCNEGKECTHKPVDGPQCCNTDADCDDFDDCTSDTCLDHLCKYEAKPDCCKPADAYFQNFPVDSLGGFTVVDDGSNVSWRVDNYRYFDEPFALYYGDPETRTYSNGGATFGTATSPTFLVPPYGKPTLSFQTYMDVEVGPPYDEFSVRVNSGSSTYYLWSKSAMTDPGVYQTWIPVEADLSDFMGEKISLVFDFDSVDANMNEGEGIYVDLIRVDVTCPQPLAP